VLTLPAFHLLEAQREDAIGKTAFDQPSCQVQRRGASRAVVVDVDDRNTRHADVVDRPLPGPGVAVAEPDETGLDVVEVDPRIKEGLLTSLPA
jgi:hypothetical protein